MRLFLATSLFLCFQVLAATAEPWPLQLSHQVFLPDNPNFTQATETYTVTKTHPATGQPIGTATLTRLLLPIMERQFVNATFGEPRPLSAAPKRYHDGVDLKAPVGTHVYSIEGGAVSYQSAGDASAVTVGRYRYVHQALNAQLRDALDLFSRPPSQPLTIPDGIRIATPLSIAAPHLHLSYREGDLYSNALARLENWTDEVPPRFITLGVTQTSVADREWLPPPVRIVPQFDPEESEEEHPFTPFDEITLPGSTGRLPVASGHCDILVRAMDAVGLEVLPPNSGIPLQGFIGGGTDRCAPVGAGYGVEELNSPTTGVTRSVVRTTYIEFLAAIPVGEVNQQPLFAYWMNGDRGTRPLENGRLGRLDYIVTNRVDEDAYLDTDTAMSRNGRYRVTATINDLQLFRGEVFPGGLPIADTGNDVSSSRDLVICNRAGVRSINSVTHPGHGRKAPHVS